MLTLVTLASCLSLASLKQLNSEISNFPLVMWSHYSTHSTQEHDNSIKFEGVIDAIKAEAGSNEADLVVIVVKEKLSTPRLVQQASELEYIRTQVLSHATVYINVDESISAD